MSRTTVLSSESRVLLPISPEMNKMMNAQPNDTSCELSGFLDVGNESSWVANIGQSDLLQNKDTAFPPIINQSSIRIFDLICNKNGTSEQQQFIYNTFTGRNINNVRENETNSLANVVQ